MNGKLKGIIFDWAGTTVDYGCFAPVQAFVEVFRHYGMEPTMDEVREPMGMLKIDHIKTMLAMPRIRQEWILKYGTGPDDESAQAMYGLFEEKLFGILKDFAEPKPGVCQLVSELRSHGIAVGSTTGYTDEMMNIVAPIAERKGYRPDVWFTPESTGQKGRPYPYMIFRNMEALLLTDVRNVAKVGDTVSDIREGKNAGVWTIGVISGSSEMGLTRQEYETMDGKERRIREEKIRERFLAAGADQVILNLEEILELI